jgi:hypothetical protein
MMSNAMENNCAAIVVNTLHDAAVNKIKFIAEVSHVIRYTSGSREVLAALDRANYRAGEDLMDIRRAATYFAIRIVGEGVDISPETLKQIDFMKVGDDDDSEKDSAS